MVTRAPGDPVTLAADDDPAALAVAASTALFERSAVVLLAGADDPAAQQGAADLAAGAGVPVLLTGNPTAGEVTRLGAETVLAVGEPAVAWAEGAALPAADVVAVGRERPEELDDLPAPQQQDADVLTTGDPAHLAAVATARAAGAAVHQVPDGDPRGSADVVTALGEDGGAVLALGGAFGPPERLAARVATAATGVQLPGGGQRLWPGRLLVALYGSPVTPSLGVLGEQPADAAVERARAVAAEYDALPAADGTTVVPTLEIITTVASSSAGPDGDFSTETDVELLRPWVDAAGAAGVYVVLDLQPGRTDFLTQARRYEELLALPHVGLALDPEWRLEPGQVHLRQIGSVGVDEVNAVATWLADLTRDRALPQKVLLLHQFRLSMIAGRERLDTSRDELAVVLHGDGNGDPGTKLASWRTLTAQPPPGAQWGWKNFYDEDTPTFSPQQTLDVEPPPVFVSYQ